MDIRLCLVLAALCVLFAIPTPRSLFAQSPVILRRVQVDPSRLVDFHAGVSPETLFVGQQATYQVVVLLDEGASSRLPRNPEYLPPELRGLLAYDLGGQQRFTHDANGKRYTAYVFQKALFPLASGTIVIPSPQLSYALRQSSSYFSREESHSVRAESASVVVKPLPEENKPADFTGAVGVLKSTVHLDAKSARVGDPLVLTLRVQGSGNIKLLPRPTLELEWASAVAGTERLQMDTSGAVVKGAKEFDWILTPSRAGDVTTPVIRYSYFNPNTKTYEVSEAEPVAFAIGAGSLATNEEGERSTVVLPLRTREVGNVSLPLMERWEVWAILAVFPLPALALLLLGVPREAPRAQAIETLRSIVQKIPMASTTTAASKRQHPITVATARDVRRLLITSLGKRLEVATDVLTDRKRTQRVLRRRGVTKETTDALLVELTALDEASFASSNTEDAATTRALSASALSLYDRVDKEALEPRAQRLLKRKTAAKTVALLLMSATLSGQFVGTARAQEAPVNWDSAVAAYKNRQFQDAANAFLKLAQQSPRDADILANWGTAAWAAGDTVSAVVAWQRAARLDPLAADLREHLLLLPSGSRDGVAEVPLIPVPLLGYAGVVLWVVGWSAVAYLLWRKRKQQAPIHALKMLAAACIVLGSASAATSAWGALQLRTDQLAVVVRPETMRIAPAVDSDAQGGAATGDVVLIKERKFLWARVEHSDGRLGWLPESRLMPLAGAALP